MKPKKFEWKKLFYVKNTITNISFGLSFSFFTLLLVAIDGNPDLPKLVWKNLFKEPGYYNLKISVLEIKDTEGDIGYTGGFTDARNRDIFINRYIARNHNKDDWIAEKRNIMSTLAEKHEIGHVKKNKYTVSYFFRKDNRYKISIIDEIVQRIETIKGFTELSFKDRKKYVKLKKSSSILDKKDFIIEAHQEIITLPYFKKSGIFDITRDEYKEAFNNMFLKDTDVLDICIKYATKEYSEVEKCYRNAVRYRSDLLNLMEFVDFYNTPVTYKKALEKSFDFEIGRNKVNVLDKISKNCKYNFFIKLDSLTNLVDKQI